MGSPASDDAAESALSLAAIRAQFPLLSRTIHGRPLVYLDNAATTQKPAAVLHAVDAYYRESNANVHRGLHFLSEAASAAYEGAREEVCRFLNARSAAEIVFTRGTTEAVNLVAQSWGRRHLGPGDAVLLSTFEHHSNLVPWQMICEECGAALRVIPLTGEGELDLEAVPRLLDGSVRLVAVAHVSNALGALLPVREVVALAHERNIPVLVDGAQAVPHLQVDVQDLGCDFYAFSGHTVDGPTGIGVLYGRGERLEAMPPWQGGGEMIRSVRFEGSTYAAPPHRFEAGTPNIGGAVGLAAALRFLGGLPHAAMARHEQGLLNQAARRLAAIPGVSLIGGTAPRIGALSFVLDGVHPHDLGTFLDQEGVAIRAGHHCAQPLLHSLGLTATARASVAVYNTAAEITALTEGVERARRFFAG